MLKEGSTERHYMSEHAGMQVIEGEKWAFNLWFREKSRKVEYEYPIGGDLATLIPQPTASGIAIGGDSRYAYPFNPDRKRNCYRGRPPNPPSFA